MADTEKAQMAMDHIILDTTLLVFIPCMATAKNTPTNTSNTPMILTTPNE